MTITGFRQGDLAPPPSELTYDLVSWLVAGVALFLALALHLLPALLAGLTVYELVQLLAGALKIVRIHDEQRKLAAISILALGVVLFLTLAGAGTVGFFNSGAGNLSTLLNKVADSIDRWRAALPSFIAEQLPADVDDLRQTMAWASTRWAAETGWSRGGAHFGAYSVWAGDRRVGGPLRCAAA